MPEPKYNFDMNLLERSISKDIDPAKKEWVDIGKDTQPFGSIICICGNKNIKNVHYFFNTQSGKMIATGKQCAKKLGLKLGQGSGRIIPAFAEFLIEYRAEYTTLENLVYTDNIRIKFIEFIKKRIGSTSNLNEAYNFTKFFVDMFNSHNCKFTELEVICNELKLKIGEKEAERLEQEKIREADRLERDKIREAERLEREKQAEVYRLEKIVKEKEERKQYKTISLHKVRIKDHIACTIDEDVLIKDKKNSEEKSQLELAEKIRQIEEENEQKNREKHERRRKNNIRMELMREIREFKLSS